MLGNLERHASPTAGGSNGKPARARATSRTSASDMNVRICSGVVYRADGSSISP
jgi:hypothetical protein